MAHTIDTQGDQGTGLLSRPPRSKFAKFSSIALIAMSASLLTACGGGLSNSDDSSSGGTGGDGSTGGDGGGTTTPPPSPVTLNLIAASPSIEVTEQVSVTAQILDNQGLPTTGNINLQITSPCITLGTSTVTGDLSENASSVTFTYLSTSCVGTDSITIAGSYNSQPVNGTIDLTVNPMALALTVDDSQLSPNDSTAVIAQIRNSKGQPISGDIKLSANSDCISANKAETSGAMEGNGSAVSFSYESTSCLGSDNLLVSGTFNGLPVSAETNITTSASGTGGGTTDSFDLNLIASSTRMEANGSTTITAQVVNQQDSPVSGDIALTANSACLTLNRATITDTLSGSGSSVTATYTPTGCFGSDQVSFTGTFNGTQISDSIGLTINPVTLSIAVNDDDLLSGESTAINAQIRNSVGQPVSGAIDLSVNSDCLTLNKSSMSGNMTGSASELNLTYSTVSCDGQDRLLFSGTFNQQPISANVQIDTSNGDTGQPDSYSLNILSSSNTIESGGVATITAQILNQQNIPTSGNIALTATSSCLTLNRSSLTGDLSATNSALELTYTANSCFGQDTLTLAGTFNGLAVSNNIPLTINPVSLSISVADSDLASGESTAISAQIRNSNGQPVSGPINLSVNSDCLTLNKSTLTGDLSGTAAELNLTYATSNCNSTDTLLFSGTFNQQPISAQTQIDTSNGDNSQSSPFSLNILPSTSTIETNATTTITVQIVDDNDAAVSGEIDLTANSACITLGRSSLDGSLAGTGSLVTASYTANGCFGTDVVSISGTFNGKSISESVSITINPVSLSVAVDDSDLLSGESASINAQIRNSNGQPVSGPIELNVNSDCLTLSKSALSGDLTADASELNLTYTTNSCDGNDTLLFSGTFNQQPISAQLDINTSDGGTGQPDSYSLNILSSNNILESGGTATITAQIVNQQNIPTSGNISLTASSSCLTLARSTLTGDLSVTDSDLELTYTANSCFGQDRLTLAGTFNGLAVSNSIPLTINPVSLSISVADSDLASGESTTINAQIRNSNGQPVTGSINLNANSDCLTLNKSTLTGDLSDTASELDLTYATTNCDSSDTLMFAGTFNQQPISAQTSINTSNGDSSQSSPFSLNILPSSSTIETDGTSAITVQVVNDQDTPISGEIDFTANSACITLGTSVLSGSLVGTGSMVNATYTPNGCFGTDIVSISGTFNGETISESVSITINPVTLSIVVDNNDLLPGESASINAQIRNSTGQPVSGSISLNANSDCLTLGKSTLSGNLTADSSELDLTYTTNSCDRNDSLLFSGTFNQQPISALAQIDTSNGDNSQLSPFGLNILPSSSTIETNGTSTITVQVVDDNDAAVSGEIDLTANSACIALGTSSLNGLLAGTGSLVTASYTPNGCFGTDVVSITGTFNGKSISESVSITINPVSLSIAIDDSDLLSGESTSINAQIRSSTGQPVSGPIELNVNSDCLTLNKSALSGDLTADASELNLTYTTNSCNGNDTLLFSGTFNQQPISAQLDINTSDGGTGQPDTYSLNILSSSNTIESGGSATITAQIVNQQNIPTSGDISLTASSSCLTLNRSTLTGNLTATDSSLTLTYTADRCFGQDQLTLAGTFNGLAISDNIALTINPVELSINVDDANLFSGQTANITAQIRNSTGQPVSGDIQLQANSDCVVLNKATLGGSLNGQGTQISFTYENNTCEGNDVVLISGKFNDQTISGDTTIKTSEGVDTQPVDEVEVNVITSLQTMESNQTSNITVQAINGQGAPLTGDFALIVNSPCLTIDRSEITGTLNVNAASSLTFTYDPKGCYGNDPLSISGTFNSQPVEAITTVTVNPVTLALNVEDNELLLNETTSITAQIQDSKGQPVSGNISLQVNSDCIVLNKSSVSGALAAQDSNLAFDYTTATCIGSDNISVAGTFDEQPVAATASILGSEATQGIPSQVTISSNTAVIGAQDEATLNIQILTANNSPASGTFNVELVSACLSAGLANIDGSTETNSGSFEVKYVPFGCSGNDDITARVRNEDETFEATLSLTVNAALPDGLSWIENQPGNSLNILGAGGVQNVKVTFALTASGVPVPQQEVAFSLLDESNSPIPSSIATLLTTSAITDNTGQITVTIKSGTRRGDVKVVATHVTSGTSAESKLIGVRGGFPNDFNISLSTHNPNAWNRTGNDPIQIVEITAFLDDKEGDIIPDGATVLFEQSESYGQFRSSEGSQSDGGSCVIENGTCSVTWVPDGNQPSDGRLTFIAYTKGHERFRDKNDNGLFDSGDDFPVLSSDDLSEPFYDKLKGNGTSAEFNNIKDTDENYKDTLTKNTAATSTGLPAFDGEFTEANGLWDGPLDMCPPENRSRCSGAEATLYASSTFILSDDTPRVCDADGNSPPAYNLNNWIVPIGSSIDIPRDLTNDDSQLYLCDINSNVLPKGTVMSWDSTGSGDVVGFIDTTIQNNLLIQPIPSAVYAPTSSNSVSILSVEAVIPQPDSGSLEWAKPFRTPSAYAFYLCDAAKNPIAYSPDNFTITPGSGVKEIPRHVATSDVYLCNNIDTALPSGTTFSWKEEGAGVFTGSTLGILSDNTYPTLLPTVNYNVPNAVDTNVDTSGKIELVVVAGNIQYTISLPFDISFIAPTP